MRWLVATVAETVPETVEAVTLRLDTPGWSGHRAGQHVDVKLTAEDGYTAERSYSIASPPGVDPLELTVVRIDDGEVSPYLTTILDSGDQMELRGPIGGWFVWDGDDASPVLLVAGGSGLVPLMAMLRHHAAISSSAPMHLVYSARTQSDLLHRDELERLAGGGRRVTITLTREPGSSGWQGERGRVDAGFLSRVLVADGLGADGPVALQSFVCGPTPFVEGVANALVAMGHDPARIRTERFGPTGG